jgi:Sucrase/ferredoxin-like
VDDSELGPHAPPIWRNAMRARGIRVITIRRDLETHHHRPMKGVRLVHVVAGRPGTTTSRARRRVVDDLHQVVTATESLASGAGPGEGWEDDDAPYALVCTNGRHDPCCATFGRPLARSLRGSDWADRVWECSHIGGDRFAGNLLLLPESLYFGRCDGPAAERVLAGYDAGRLDLPYFRGRSTFTLVEQAAEHFVRTELALDALDAITAAESLGDGQVSVRLADRASGDAGKTVVVTVAHSRVPAPTPLTCKGAEGLTFPQFRLVGIEPG